MENQFKCDLTVVFFSIFFMAPLLSSGRVCVAPTLSDHRIYGRAAEMRNEAAVAKSLGSGKIPRQMGCTR
jgi:hypothetical protein